MKDELAKTAMIWGPLKDSAPPSQTSSMVDISVAAEEDKEQTAKQPQLLQPKTPAPLEDELFSPTDLEEPPSTGPSTSAPQTSEMASTSASLEEVVSNTGAAGGRGSRRARAPVSYAEPNLRDKMRRPGRQFVDAVAGGRESSAKRDSSDEKDSGNATATGGRRTVTIKKEKPENSAWKKLPAASPAVTEESKSPLLGKTTRSKQRLSLAGAKTKPAVFKDGPATGDDEKNSASKPSSSKTSIYDVPSSSPASRVPRRHSIAPVSRPSTTTSERDVKVASGTSRKPLKSNASLPNQSPEKTTESPTGKKRTFEESAAHDVHESSTKETEDLAKAPTQSKARREIVSRRKYTPSPVMAARRRSMNN